MKKVLLFISSMLLSLNIASADTVDLPMLDYYDDFDTSISNALVSNSAYQQLITYYNNNLSSDYPYFVVWQQNGLPYQLTAFPSLPSSFYFVKYGNCGVNNGIGGECEYTFRFDYSNYVSVVYSNNNISSSTITTSHIFNFYSLNRRWNNSGDVISHTGHNYYFYSNFNPIVSNVIKNSDNEIISDDIPVVLQFGPFTSSSLNFSTQYFEVVAGQVFPSYFSLYNGSYAPSVSYTEIDLNDYSYVALSLKNYNVSESFSTNFIIKGQLCITPVYDYGMTEKSQYSGAGYQVESCSIPYESFTPYQVYILQSDLTYHSIYYLKAYDTSIDNIVKVDSNIFNITYITSENADSPQVSIGGRSYPTIPYDNLTSSATISTEEGYVSGQVKNVFDYSSDSDTLNTLFSNPLQALNTAFSAITIMFSLIGSFIAMLPSTLQAFLFVGFSVGICLGVIKILI